MEGRNGMGGERKGGRELKRKSLKRERQRERDNG